MAEKWEEWWKVRKRTQGYEATTICQHLSLCPSHFAKVFFIGQSSKSKLFKNITVKLKMKHNFILKLIHTF